MWRFQYGYIFLSCEKVKKRKKSPTISLLMVLFLCFGPFWVLGVTAPICQTWVIPPNFVEDEIEEKLMQFQFLK